MAETGVGRGKAVVLAGMGEELLGPRLLHDLDGLDEERAVGFLLRVRVGVELGSLVAADTASEPHFDTPLRQVVEDGEVLGEPDGMPPHRDVGHLPDTDPRGSRGDVRTDQDRIGQVPSAEGLEVVLADPHRMETQLLGQHDLLTEVPEHLVGRPAGRR